MDTLSELAKRGLYNALNGRQSGVFVVDGKLVSIEVENNDTVLSGDSQQDDLSQEIEEYPELKNSLSRYLNNPEMARYSKSELRSKRYEKRK